MRRRSNGVWGVGPLCCVRVIREGLVTVADEDAADHEDRRAVGEVGFVVGGRVGRPPGCEITLAAVAISTAAGSLSSFAPTRGGRCFAGIRQVTDRRCLALAGGKAFVSARRSAVTSSPEVACRDVGVRAELRTRPPAELSGGSATDGECGCAERRWAVSQAAGAA